MWDTCNTRDLAALNAYLAGIVDGEGSITTHPGSSRRFIVEVRVFNTNLEVLCLLRDCFGGSIQQRPIKSPRHRQSYCWVLSGGLGVQNCLRVIRPYLRIKQEQADLVLEMAALIVANGRGRTPSEPEMVRRRALHGQVAMLNRTGHV